MRHCDVENPDGLIYGRLKGFGLSSLGRAQADRTADFLRAVPLDAVYVSPMLRARQTARAIARLHPEVTERVSLLLNEVRTSYQGLLAKDVSPSVNMFDHPRDPLDETMADVFRRMNRLVRRVIVLHAGSNIVCVSHAAPIAIVRAGLEGRPLTIDALRGPEAPEKGSVTRISFSEADVDTISYVDVHQSVAMPSSS